MMGKKRSKGITIFSLAEIILGLVGLALATWWTISIFTICYAYMNISEGFLPLFASVYIISLTMFIIGVITFLLKSIRKILSIALFIPMLISLMFIVWLLYFQYQGTNINVGFLVLFASMSYIYSVPMFIVGVLTFLLKPIGRILNIYWMILWLPISIFLIIYLLRTDVKEQFK